MDSMTVQRTNELDMKITTLAGRDNFVCNCFRQEPVGDATHSELEVASVQ